MYIDILETETGRQVFEDGKAEEARKTIIDVLKLRFKAVPKDIVRTINGLSGPDVLLRLRQKAFSCQTFEKFLSTLKDVLPGSTTKKRHVSQKRGTDEAFFKLMRISGQAMLMLLGLSAREAENYTFRAVVLKEKKLEPDVEGIPVLETEGRRVFIEFQGTANRFIRYNLAAKILWSCAQEEYDGRVIAAIIYTDSSIQEAALPVDAFSETIGQLMLQNMREIVLTRYSLAQLTAVDPRLIVLAPFTVPENTLNSILSAHGREWKKQIDQIYGSPDQQKQAVDVLGLFLLARFRQLTREEIKAMLDFDILDTVAGRQVYEEGREEGRKEVREEVREEGIKEGIITGIILALKNRFGDVPDNIEHQIATRKKPQLEQIFTQALICETEEQFYAFLNQQSPPGLVGSLDQQ